MYYVQKSGVYLHGIFGIYKSEIEAIKRCTECANNDIDSYHDWQVLLYSKSEKTASDPQHEKIFQCKKEVNNGQS